MCQRDSSLREESACPDSTPDPSRVGGGGGGSPANSRSRCQFGRFSTSLNLHPRVTTTSVKHTKGFAGGPPFGLRRHKRVALSAAKQMIIKASITPVSAGLKARTRCRDSRAEETEQVTSWSTQMLCSRGVPKTTDQMHPKQVILRW
ncbi:hypothetical protein AGIG_G17211 [Arapaima gigas]